MSNVRDCASEVRAVFSRKARAAGRTLLRACGRRFGGRVVTLAKDLADDAHRRVVVDAVQDFGRLDILLNNASSPGAPPLQPLSEYPLEQLDKAFCINLVAPIALIQTTLPLLRKAGGLIINVTSDAARAGYDGWDGYGLTKAALELATRTLAGELRGHGIGVVAVDPGDLRTRMHQDAFAGEDISERPVPEVTLPFWSCLFEQPRLGVTGRRYEAQSDRWEIDPPEELMLAIQESTASG